MNDADLEKPLSNITMSSETTPRDVKLLHLILASMGVSSYQDHVPLQLVDCAYRYTISVLQDALVYADYAHANGSGQPAGMAATNSPLTVDDIRLAVSARTAYQFKPTAPKELLLELAQERNKRPLPPVPQGYGLRLPPETFCLTGRDRDLEEDEDIPVTGYEEMTVEPEAGSQDPNLDEEKDQPQE